MTDHGQITAPRSAQLSARLEEAINNLSLGIVVFDEKREVVFCNARYREMYGLSPEEVKPGTPTRELIQHRLNLGLKVQTAPDDYIRERVGRDIALDTTVQEFTDGRIIAYTVYPMPGGGGMATHEDITEREELNARLKKQYELGQRAGRGAARQELPVRHRDQQHVAGALLLRCRPPPDRRATIALSRCMISRPSASAPACR